MLYKHNKLKYSSNYKISTMSLSDGDIINFNADFIGNPDRLFIAVINKETNKRILIRDIKKGIYKYSNTISVESDGEFDIYLNFKSNESVWIELTCITSKGKDGSTKKSDLGVLKTHLNKDTKINAEVSNLEILSKKQLLKKKLIKTIKLHPKSVYRNELACNFEKFNSIMIEGYDNEYNLILKRKITSGDTFKTIIRTLENTSDLHLYVHESVNIHLTKCDTEYLDKIFDGGTTKLCENSITAAMATYPAREHIIEDAIDSIIDQVDTLYIYLNNYSQVPSFITEHPKSYKIEVVVDPKSKLRAAAKFFWLGKIPGHHLTIDDDIIYPKDYVKVLLKASEESNHQAIVGVHGSIFKEYVQDASNCRTDVFNFQKKLDKKHKVHMIGTGTALFPNAITRRVNTKELFEHPLANDELLAIMCKKHSIPIFAVARSDKWLIGNPNMEYGIFEEKQLNKDIKSEVNQLVTQSNPWPLIA